MAYASIAPSFIGACSTALSTLLAAEGAEPGGLGGLFVPIIIVVVIFYFLVFRPSSKERKQREGAIKALKKHDKVVTNAGIYGSVMSIDDDTVVLRIDDKNNVRVKFSRQAIWQVLDADGSTPGKDVKKAEAKA